MSIAEHLVAHTRDGDSSLVEPERVRWLWTRMRAAFGDALGSLVMLDHLHLQARPGGRARFERVLRGFTRRYGVRWDVLPPEPANTPAIAERQLRYILRNPVTAGLVDDPWAWPWSTLRDLGGVVADPWTQLGQVARVCRRSAGQLLRFVTSFDGRVAPPLAQAELLVAPIDACRAAVASTLRCTLDETADASRPRRITIQLAQLVGSIPNIVLAERLGCSVRTVQRLQSPPDPAVPAAFRCLADPRLRVSDVELHAASPRRASSSRVRFATRSR